MFLQIIVLIILILLNAYFAATEIAFISLNDAKIEKEAKNGSKKAKQIVKMLKNPSKFLATIQIGITLAGFLSSAFASDAFADVLAPTLNKMMPFLSIDVWRGISIIIITGILSFFTLVFGELVPKRLAMKYYEKIAYMSIGVIKAISIVTAPFVKLLTFSTNIVSKIFGVGENEEAIVTEEEIKMMIDEGREKGTIEEEEKEMINNVFEFNDTTASEIMIHRTDIFAIEINDNLSEILNDVDEYGGTAGLLTMEDILEELVGNIFDEYDDVENEYEKLDENTYLISGSVSLYELKKILNVNVPEGDYETLSGYLLEELGRLPKEGENVVIETKDVTYKIEEYEEKRIMWVKACKNNIEELKKEE